MSLAAFLEQRRPEWKKLEALLEHVEGSGLAALDDQQAVAFAQLYRRAASDLNQAQTFVSGDATGGYLNDLVARCYVVIHAKTRVDLRGVFRAMFLRYPIVFRRSARHVLLAAAIVAGAAVFGFLASYFDPMTARGYLLPTDFPMIQPGQDNPLQTTGELAAFSGFLFRHNVSVTLVAFALGLTLGVGTVWLLFETGVMMGALAAVFVEAGELRSFCTGILPHGVLEIPAILLGAAGGLLLAQAILRARPWTRLEELTRTGKEALWLVSGCLPMLAVAALLEAGVARAPDWFFDSGLKLAVAAFFALCFAVYVVWGARGTDAGNARRGASTSLADSQHQLPGGMGTPGN
ncbi:MAG TPA: stage II sporulation protein M [Gemmataceae bacterium]|nr:stage II sporulation protein M [Gemmataceae bacterium]